MTFQENASFQQIIISEVNQFTIITFQQAVDLIKLISAKLFSKKLSFLKAMSDIIKNPIIFSEVQLF
jgi:hypothetical protein